MKICKVNGLCVGTLRKDEANYLSFNDETRKMEILTNFWILLDCGNRKIQDIKIEGEDNLDKQGVPFLLKHFYKNLGLDPQEEVLLIAESKEEETILGGLEIRVMLQEANIK